MSLIDKSRPNFVNDFNIISSIVHTNALQKGFWENTSTTEKIALAHSELSELLEALREGNKESEKIPPFSGAEEESADTIIRLMDMAVFNNWNLTEAILSKIAYNAGRPRKHGKLF